MEQSAYTEHLTIDPFGSVYEGVPVDAVIIRQQTRLLQIMLIGQIIYLLIVPLQFLPYGMSITGRLVVSGSAIIVAGITAVAVVLLRRGHFTPAVLLATLSLIVGLTIVMLARGAYEGRGLIVTYTIPVMMAGLVLRKRGLVLVLAMTVVCLSTVVILEQASSPLVGFAWMDGPILPGTIGNFFFVVITLGIFVNQFNGVLRRALTAAHTREQELDQLRQSLEATVAERTQSLEEALQTVAERESNLVRTLEQLDASQHAIRELSTPVIPILEDVLVVPLIGVLEQDRAATLMTNVLQTVEQARARYVIFDVTGVPMVDALVAETLLQATAAVQLLGTRTVLVGLRPEVAQTVASLGLELRSLKTFANLQMALEDLLRRRLIHQTDGAKAKPDAQAQFL